MRQQQLISNFSLLQFWWKMLVNIQSCSDSNCPRDNGQHKNTYARKKSTESTSNKIHKTYTSVKWDCPRRERKKYRAPPPLVQHLFGARVCARRDTLNRGQWHAKVASQNGIFQATFPYLMCHLNWFSLGRMLPGTRWMEELSLTESARKWVAGPSSNPVVWTVPARSLALATYTYPARPPPPKKKKKIAWSRSCYPLISGFCLKNLRHGMIAKWCVYGQLTSIHGSNGVKKAGKEKASVILLKCRLMLEAHNPQRLYQSEKMLVGALSPVNHRAEHKLHSMSNLFISQVS